jgi:hypothetical protein
VSSLTSSASYEVPEISTNAKRELPPVDMSDSYANTHSADVSTAVIETATAIVESPHDVSQEAEASEACEELPVATSDTSDSDELAIDEQEVKASEEVVTEEVAIAGLIQETIIIANDNAEADESTASKDIAAAIYRSTSSPPAEEASADEPTSADDVAGFPKPTYKGARSAFLFGFHIRIRVRLDSFSSCQHAACLPLDEVVLFLLLGADMSGGEAATSNGLWEFIRVDVESYDFCDSRDFGGTEGPIIDVRLGSCGSDERCDAEGGLR